MSAILHTTPNGLYCPAGEFYIDPWRPVERAIITHAHGDHARRGCGHYLSATGGEAIMRVRLGAEISLQTLAYGEAIRIGNAKVSLHPAGHLLGSAQVRVEHRGEVWVASGDYKTTPDRTCVPFEPVRCHTFITESTFGLPIYRWRPQEEIFAEINAWWRGNQERGWTSVLLCYALGKAQRVLAGVDAGIGPILLHGTIPPLNAAYEAGGIALPKAEYATVELAKATKGRALLLAPPSTAGSTWMKKFEPASLAMASGWMPIRGARRRRAMDRGFVLSDHADWPGLQEAIRATGAQRVGVTHGYIAPMVRWLTEQGLEAFAVETRYEGEAEDAAPEEPVAG